MKILILGTKGIPGHHGVEVVVDSLVPHMASMGHEITVYGYDSYTTPTDDYCGVRIKTVAGSCVSLGVLIENKSPIEIIQEIDNGKYDKEINKEKTETSDEKKKELDEYFEKVKKDQEKFVKAQEAKKEEQKEEPEKKDENE